MMSPNRFPTGGQGVDARERSGGSVSRDAHPLEVAVLDVGRPPADERLCFPHGLAEPVRT